MTLGEREPSILSEKNWPPPTWLAARPDENKGRKKTPSYESYHLGKLRAKYMELEAEFRSTYGNYYSCSWMDHTTARISAELLHSTRRMLENELPDLLLTANILGSVDRYMIWLFNKDFTTIRAARVLSRLRRDNLITSIPLAEELTRILSTNPSHVVNLDGKLSELNHLRGFLDEVIGEVNGYDLRQQIGSGLQIARLRTLRTWGLVVLITVFLLSPLFVQWKSGLAWPVEAMVFEGFLPPWIHLTWVNALVIAMVGATGGFLSGLLQARNSQVGLVEFQENMLKLQLRPLVGALVALVLFMLLSWDVLTGIKVTSAGSFFLIAFVAGFSERFFLKLLDIGNEEVIAQTAETAQTAQLVTERVAGLARREAQLITERAENPTYERSSQPARAGLTTGLGAGAPTEPGSSEGQTG